MDKIYSRKRIYIPKFQKNKNKDAKKYSKIIKITIVVVIAIYTASMVINGLNPIIDVQCKTMAKSIATKICNEQASVVMNKYKYDDLCTTTRDANGNISLISANVVTVNGIASDVAIKIQEELNNKNNGKFYIPLGSFTGSRALSGRGPNVELKMSTVGNVETDLKSEFISKGINQTLHKVYLQVCCKVIVLTPFNSIEEKIVNQVLLAEAVIIGITPNTYYNLEGLDKNGVVDTIQ